MIRSGYPTISCVMVTKGRLDCIKLSVKCYLNQTYSKKHLLILSQGSSGNNQHIESYIKELNRSDIQFYVAPENLTLGCLRNTSVEIATGEVICQWDDDDLYHPERLMTQFNALRNNSRNVASLYCDFLKYFKNTSELYWCDWSINTTPSHRYLCGTVMFYKEMFGRFPMFYPDCGAQCHVEEDLNVLEKLMLKGDIAPVLCGHQYIYVYHGNNTYDLDHHYLGINTKWGKKLYSESELIDRRIMLEDTFDKVGISDSVIVRSEIGTAFIYNPIERN